MKKVFSLTLCFVLFLTVFCGCNTSNNPTSPTVSDEGLTDANAAADTTATPDESALKIVTTVFPAYDFARAVTGGKAEIKMLLKPGGEVHSYAPTAEDMLDIGKCDVFICIGGESDEDWVEDTIESSGNTGLTLIKMTDCVAALQEAEALEPEDDIDDIDDIDDLDDDDDDIDDEPDMEDDEHVWTSPVNAQKIVSAIEQTLSRLDSANSVQYKANADAYNAKLAELDSSFKDIAAKSTVKTLIFADRFPFRYFCHEYGFDFIAAFSGCSASADPSAETIKTLIDEVNKSENKTVFTIEFSSGATADTICEATGAAKAELHSCHNVSLEDFNNGVTYVDLMNRNIKTLQEVLINVSD